MDTIELKNGEELGVYQLVTGMPRQVMGDRNVDLKSTGLGRNVLLIVEKITEDDQ